MTMTPEALRLIVREELERNSKKTLGGKVMEFLNTGFCLWLLSTLVVGVVTFTYSERKARREAEDLRTRKMVRIDTELRLRFFTSIDKITYRWAREGVNTVKANNAAKNIAAMHSEMVFSQLVKDHVFLPEFADSGTRSLLIEYYFLTTNARERIAMKRELEMFDAGMEAFESKTMTDEERLKTLEQALARMFVLWIKRQSMDEETMFNVPMPEFEELNKLSDLDLRSSD